MCALTYGEVPGCKEQMAEQIPFLTSDDTARIAKRLYADSEIVRLPIDRATSLIQLVRSTFRVWLDPCVDGMDDIDSRRDRPWFAFMKRFPKFEDFAKPTFQAKPIALEVQAFVDAVLDHCASHKPTWITVPQLPLVTNSDRNKINRALAVATGKWKSRKGFSGKLILPLIFAHQEQVNGKTARNPKVQQAERCYHESQADGLWVVERSLVDDSGSATLRNKRLPGIVDLHQELNERIATRIRIAGPYWGLNLVLWAKGLVDYPAIGIGSGYQYFLAGGHIMQPSVKIVLPTLRRRVGVSVQLGSWLDKALTTLGTIHPAFAELNYIKKQYNSFSSPDISREQVAAFYKSWLDLIASAPKSGRSMALFQDLSAAYALGKSLPDLPDEGTAHRPEAVVEPLMLSCL
jgi:hypothetical protein